MKTPSPSNRATQSNSDRQAILRQGSIHAAPCAGQLAGAKIPPTPEVQQLVNTQGLFISKLKDAVSGLRDRLSTVLIEVPLSESIAGAAQSAPGSELGKALDVNNEDISRLTAHIKYLTNQLAV